MEYLVRFSGITDKNGQLRTNEEAIADTDLPDGSVARLLEIGAIEAIPGTDAASKPAEPGTDAASKKNGK